MLSGPKAALEVRQEHPALGVRFRLCRCELCALPVCTAWIKLLLMYVFTTPLALQVRSGFCMEMSQEEPEGVSGLSDVR